MQKLLFVFSKFLRNLLCTLVTQIPLQWIALTLNDISFSYFTIQWRVRLKIGLEGQKYNSIIVLKFFTKSSLHPLHSNSILIDRIEFKLHFVCEKFTFERSLHLEMVKVNKNYTKSIVLKFFTRLLCNLFTQIIFRWIALT